MNNYYPSYPNVYKPYQPQNGITWVQGIEGAKAYQLMPNSNTLLMDSENDGVFYIKVSDQVGMCNLRTFKYEETTQQPGSQPAVDLSNYITRDELNNILNKRLDGGNHNGKQPISTTKPGAEQ